MQPLTKEPQELEAEGKRAFAAGRFADAARAFEQASRGFALGQDAARAAEMNNNLSVALLQDKRPQEAFDAAAGTDLTFEKAGDVKKQAMAVGNQAAALEALKRPTEALEYYERAAGLFAQAGEGDLRAMVLKSAAAIRLKQGKLNDSAMDMLGSLGATEKPSPLQHFLKFLLRFKP